MSIEHTARAIVQQEIRRPVHLHDDGSQPGMYDLRVGSPQAPELAIECVAAVDPVRVETWNVGPARGPLHLNLSGDWYVVLKPNAQVKRVLQELNTLLRLCEQRGLYRLPPVRGLWRRADRSLFRDLERLRVEEVYRFRPKGEGLVHLGMTGVGGWVDPSGREVPGWASDFLRAPERSDVLAKLRASGASERHVFVPMDLGAAPWPVESYLGRPIEELPDSPPALPAPVTGIWLWMVYAQHGVRWDGTRWRIFGVPTGGRKGPRSS